MKGYKVLIYLGILVAVLAYIYIVEIKHKQADSERKEQSSRLVQLDKDQINEIRISSLKGQEIDLKRTNPDKWGIISPVNTEADLRAVRNLLSAATQAQPEKTVSEKDVKWEDYGLDKSDLELAFGSQGKTVKMSFGASNPSRSSYYFRVEGDPRLFLVADTLKTSLNKSVFDLRDKSVTKFSPDELNEIEIVRDGQEIVFKHSDGKWRIVKPIDAIVKAPLIKSLLRSVSGLEAKEIIDDRIIENNPYDFENSKNRIMLHGKDFSKTITFGAIKENKTITGSTGNTRYLSVSGQSPVYLIDDKFFIEAKLDPETMMDRSIISAEPLDVEKIEIELMGRSWSFSKSGDHKWRMEKPQHRDKLADWLVSGILWSIKDLNYTSKTLPIPEDLAPYHLDKPQLFVWIYRKGSERPIFVSMGWQSEAEASSENKKTDTKAKPQESKDTADQEIDQPKIPGIVYAIVDPPNDKPAVYTLDGAFIGRLRLDLDQLSKKE